MSAVKKDVFGAILENMVNTRPIEGGVRRKARYCAHEGRMYTEEEQVDREMILRENAEKYKANKGRYGERKDMAGDVPLRIPKMDYYQLFQDFPHLNSCSKEERAKFFRKLYREHPEYRIG